MDNTKVVKTYCPVSGKHFALEVLKIRGDWKVVNMVDISDEEARLTVSEVRQNKFFTADNLQACRYCRTRQLGSCSCQRKHYTCKKNSPFDFMCIYCKEMQIDYSLPSAKDLGQYKAGDKITLSQGKEIKIVTFSNVTWKKFDNIQRHDTAAEFRNIEPKVHVVTKETDIEFHGYNVSKMDEGVYYEIPKTDDFFMECHVDTSKISPHPGGYLYIDFGIITAMIDQNGGTFSINGKNIGRVGAKFKMELSLTEKGKYEVKVNDKVLGSSFVQSKGNVAIKFGFTHESHFCNMLSHAYLRKISMTQGVAAETSN